MPETYRPQDVIMTFNGIPFSGFMDGTMITAEKNNEAFALNIGSTGAGARAQTSDESGRVTVRLQQTSPVNAALSALHELDKASGDGIGPLAIKDLSGADVVAAASAWIVTTTTLEYSNEITVREWIFESENLQILPGGNP